MKRLGMLVGILASLALGACGKGNVDCDKLVNHMMDVSFKETAASLPEEAKSMAKKALDDTKASAIKECKEGKNGKVTGKQYDCVMKAGTLAEITKCTGS